MPMLQVWMLGLLMRALTQAALLLGFPNPMDTPALETLRLCGWSGLAFAGALCVLASVLQRRARRPIDAALRRLDGDDAWVGDLVERT